MELMIPDIPRSITAISEWLACLLFLWPLKKRWNKGITIGILIVALCLQIYFQRMAGSININFWIPGMIFNGMFMMVYVLLCAKISVREAVFWASCAFIVSETLAALEWCTSSIIWWNEIATFSWERVAFGFFFMLLFLSIIYWSEKHIQAETLEIHGYQACGMLMITLIIFLVSNLEFLYIIPNYGALQVFMFSNRALIDFCGVIIIFLQQKSMKERQSKHEMMAINHILQMQYKQYLDFKENSDYISRQCHNLKHQIDAVRQSSPKEEQEEWLAEMEKAVNEYNAQTLTGNAVLDSILTKKKQYCAFHNIQFNCQADGRTLDRIAVRDICTIFGNLLDNSIEYVSKIQNKDFREVFMTVIRKKSFLVIKVENYCEEDLLLDNELPKTTKKDKEFHGYGLQSVLYTVKKYNGTMTVEAKNKKFIVRIMIPQEDNL